MFQGAKTIAVWSDFKAYEYRVQQDKQCAHVLNSGGENVDESFNDLLEKIWNLHTNWNYIRVVGILLVLLSAIQILSRPKKIPTEKQIGT